MNNNHWRARARVCLQRSVNHKSLLMPLANRWQLLAASMPSLLVDARLAHCVFTRPFLYLFAHTAWHQSSGVRSSREMGRRWLESTCLFYTTQITATPSPGKTACKAASASVGAACGNIQQSICIHPHGFTCLNNALLLATWPLGSTLALSIVYLWQAFLSPDCVCGKMSKKPSSSGRVFLAVTQEALKTNRNSSILCPRTIPHANVTVVEAMLDRAV